MELRTAQITPHTGTGHERDSGTGAPAVDSAHPASQRRTSYPDCSAEASRLTDPSHCGRDPGLLRPGSAFK